MQTPWAIILCKYQDDDSEPYPRQRYEELFTSAGSGKLNMVDFFADMSHGKLDLTGSQVFGWHTLDKNQSDYVGSGPNQQGRQDLLAWARAAEPQSAKFFSIVAVTNRPSDLFGGVSGAATDDNRWSGSGMSNLSPGLMGQEMGHGYGLQHSRSAGSTADYQDPWDTMSTPTWLKGRLSMAPHPYFAERDRRGNPVFRLGPGLNAANMWSRGWLDMGRVWVADREEDGTRVELRPLHHRELPGYLAAQVGRHFVEFRIPERWDAGIGQAVVLIHDVWYGISYLQYGGSGNQGLLQGDAFRLGDPADPLGWLQVTAIDAANRTATISVTRRPSRRWSAGPAIPIGRLGSGGEYFLFVNGRLKRVPPRSPMREIVEQAALFEESADMGAGAAGDLFRTDALTRIRDRADAELRHLRTLHGPADQGHRHADEDATGA